jgi:site-specific DNA recombinase
MKVALYARVSSDAQAQRGTISSQLEALQAAMASSGHEVVAVYTDDGYSGARLDRPGLDALRDAAIAGAFEAVWCLSPDRLARSFAYQVLVTDELARLGVDVCFTDTPPIADDPQARLLVQVQGLFAEYERAKLSERVRRGKLYRVRAGEAVFARVAYGYRRVPRSAAGPARLEIYEPEATVVRRMFDEYASGTSMRQIARHLYHDGVASPDGKEVWPVATIAHLLRNPAYAGTAAWYRYDYVPAPELKRARKIRRPREDWVEVPVPAIVTAEVFATAQAIVTDNSRFSTRNTPPETFLLRGLVLCGPCGLRLFCDNKRSSRSDKDKKTRYYGCPNHDPIKAGGPQRRCTERLIRADELDAFVFDQLKAVLLRPQLLLAGEAALAGRDAVPDDELLAAQLERTGRQIEQAQAERRRLADLYQADLITLPELQRRAKEITSRREALESQQTELQNRHRELAGANQIRRRIANFAARVADGLEQLDFDQRQRLLRLVVEEVRVTGWQVEIRLRVPLDDEPPNGGSRRRRTPKTPTPTPKSPDRRRHANQLSSRDGLRSANQSSVHAPRQGHRRSFAGLDARARGRTW